jgi:hypothetical protein
MVMNELASARGGIRILILLLLASLLTSCSTARLAYNNLDRLVAWQGGSYLGLDRAQRAQLREDFRPLWDWHRATQLPLYAVDLQELAGILEAGNFDREALDRTVLRANIHAQTAYAVAIGPAVGVARGMSDEQITALAERVTRDAAERMETFTEGGEAAWRERIADDMRDGLRRWAGRLSPEQDQRVERWAAEREATPDLWLDYQQTWTADLFALLLDRHDDDFEYRLRALLEGRDRQRGDDLMQAAAADRERWLQLMLDLESTLGDRQRQRLVSRLRGYAEDFERLAAQR